MRFIDVLRTGWHDQRVAQLKKERYLLEQRFACLDLPGDLRDMYVERYSMYIELEEYQRDHA